MLHITNIGKGFGERMLFEGLSFTLGPRDRLGIIGRNGSGKTTLLNILAGSAEPDAGVVIRQKGVTVGVLEQSQQVDDGRGLMEAVLAARPATAHLEHRRDLIHDLLAETDDPAEHDRLLVELGDIETRYEHAGGWTLEYEAAVILGGLGFTPDDHKRPLASFSGGWRMRAGMAGLLLSAPDILFLDEPTNHLDLEAVVWLEDYLTQYDGAVMVISHDRRFLDRVATGLVALDADGVRLHHGGYSSYLVGREKDREIRDATIKNQERFIESEQRFIDRFRSKNTKATQVQSRIKKLEKLERVTAGKKERTMKLKLPPAPRSGKTSAVLDRVGFGYDDNPLYEDLDLNFVRGDRVAFIGPNGAGKSTLLKLLAGILTPTMGIVRLGHNVQPVYYAQHQAEQLVANNTVLAEMRRAAPDEADERLRTILGTFLFSGNDVEKVVRTLSGGEQARLSLARLFLRPANLLLMDEPTNHLDIPSRDVLAEALMAYDGTLCLITHDRDLIDRTATKVLDIRDGMVIPYIGNYRDYLAKKRESASEDAAWRASLLSASDDDDSKSHREQEKDRKRIEADRRNKFHRETKKQKNRISVIEREIAAIGIRIREIEQALADPSSFESTDAFNAALNEYDKLKVRLGRFEEEWLALESAVEAAREQMMGGD